MNTEMKLTTFVAFVVSFALSIWGRRLRENAFGELSDNDRIRVSDKMPNYTSTEMVPFAGLLLGLVGILLFRLAWLRVAYSIFLPLLVLLVAGIHLRTRRRFRTFDLPAAFVSQYEQSRIVSYSALVVPFTVVGWIVYR